MNTRIQKAWDRVTRIAVAVFVGGLTLSLVLHVGRMSESLTAILYLVTLIALTVAFVGSVKTFGGLVTGMTAFITGVVLWAAGSYMIGSAESSYTVRLKDIDYSDPLHIVGTQLDFYGLLMLVVGGVTATVAYLRRVLRAVEGNKGNISG